MAEELKSVLENQQTYPWLVFRLNGRCYALTSEVVTSILILPERVTMPPQVPVWIRGIFNLRGDAIALLDMRSLFGQQTMREETEAFSQMLEARKQDHIRWVNELKLSIEENRDFLLATDPHKCAFGKWYDSYVGPNHAISFHLGKIDEPHKKLHQCAVEVYNCRRDCEHCALDTCRREALRKATEEYCPQVVQLIEETKQLFVKSAQEMVIVLERGDSRMGIVVDEVLAIEELIDENRDSQNFHSTQYVHAICRSASSGEHILMLNLDRVFEAIESAKLSV